MKKYTLIFFCLAVQLCVRNEVNAQNVNIPDANFKANLVGNASINTNGDTEIQVSEAEAFTGTINVAAKGIADLAGIEAFVAITGLYCNSNSLNNLDVSNNTELTMLNCRVNSLSSLDVSKNTKLTELDCSENSLSSLDVSNNTALSLLSLGSNSLTNLDVSNNTALTSLGCAYNNLSSLDVSKNIALTRLFFQFNSISSIDLSKNTALQKFSCGSNAMNNLDLSKNIVLTELNCRSNQLNSLDVSNNTALTLMACGFNSLSSLDVSKNTSLNNFTSDNNNLSSLDLRNGNNNIITYFDASNNPSLGCINVSDVAFATTNWTNVDPGVSFDLDCDPEPIVNIPDANFKSYLVGNTSINTNGDTEMQVSEAEAFTGSILVNNLEIVDLTGIEAFIEITNLQCGSNALSSLNISANTKLILLDCGDNSLSSIDVSSNTALTYLNCYNNSLSEIDVSKNTALDYLNLHNNSISSLDVSTNTALTYLRCSKNSLGSLDIQKNIMLNRLYCSSNSLSNLDVSSITALARLNCDDNPLNSIDISNNTSLTSLSCENNSLNSLDVSNNILLTNLYCSNNSLSNLDVSNNTLLTNLWCRSNSLSSIDVSKNTALMYLALSNNSIGSLNVSNNIALNLLFCDENSLENLDIRNGNNSSITNFNASSNPALICISVSDVDFATANWTNIDAGVSFSSNCNPEPTVNIPNAIFKAYLVGNASINTDGDVEIQVSEAESFTDTIDVQDLGIEDLTGIEAFINLSNLICRKNPIRNLDISKNTKLIELDCSQNALSSLDVTKNTTLLILTLETNFLTNLDVSKNLALTKLNCSYNYLKSLDLSSNTALTKLRFSYNQIKSIDLTKNIALAILVCNNNFLGNLDLNKNTALTILECSSNSLSNLDVSQNTALSELFCNKNSLNNLDVSKNLVLTRLSCYNTSLSSLDISNNIILSYLHCSENSLTSIDISNNTILDFFACNRNLITELDVSKNTVLTYLYCNNNLLSSLDVSKNTSLAYFQCKNNSLISLDVRNGNNSNIVNFGADNNPELSCISVSDVGFASANWVFIDAGVSFNTKCRSSQEISFDALETKSFGDANFDLTASSSSGLPISYASSDEAVVTISGSTITIVGSGTATITASQGGNSNFDPASDVAQVISVEKATLTATANSQGKTYGDANPTLTLSYSGFVLGEDESVLDTAPTGSTSADETSPVNSYAIAVAGGMDNNYDFDYTQSTLTIDKALLSVSADDQSKTYGDANPTLTLSYSGFVLDEDESVLDTAPTGSTSADETSPVNSYAIAVAGGMDNNYDFDYAEGTLNIEKASQSISFDAIDEQTLETDTLVLSATSSVNLDVYFTIVSGPATINGEILMFTDLGTVTVEATQSGNDNYFSADPVQQTFDVVTITGLSNPSISISIYPNPTSDYLNLNFDNMDIKQIQLLQMDGRLLYNYGSINKTIDLRGVISGVYLLSITTSEKVFYKRIIKK